MSTQQSTPVSARENTATVQQAYAAFGSVVGDEILPADEAENRGEIHDRAALALEEFEGVFAAQEIKPQARMLAEDRGIRCLVLDYDAMRGLDDRDSRLF